MDITDLPAHDPSAVRLARDARAHALRTGDAVARDDDCICSKRGRVLAGSWYTYGILCLKRGVLVKTKVKGIVRFMPPPPPGPVLPARRKPRQQTSYPHAMRRRA